MEKGGYAASGVKHCVRPVDMTGDLCHTLLPTITLISHLLLMMCDVMLNADYCSTNQRNYSYAIVLSCLQWNV